VRRGRRPTAGDHSALGRHLYQIGAYDLAIAELREATRLLPGHPTLQYNLACAYAACRREEEAIAVLRQAISLDAGHIKAHLLLGQLLAARGQAGAARMEFDAVLALHPECPETEKARGELTRLEASPTEEPGGDSGKRGPRDNLSENE
jgi:tetratricopeptide (TPR) repeat protein